MLVEMTFIPNPGEEKMLLEQAHQERSAHAFKESQPACP